MNARLANSRMPGRWTHAWLLAGLIALAISVGLLIATAGKLAEHRQRQTTATEYALTLTRLASAIAVEDSGFFHGDQIGRLVAMADVQSGALSEPQSSALFKLPANVTIREESAEILQQWTAIRDSLSAINSASIGVNTSVDSEVADFGSQADSVLRLSLSFDAVFDAITSDTLSVPLLRKVSQIRSDINNIKFLTEVADAVEYTDKLNLKIAQLKSNVVELRSLSLSGSGVSLLGYETNNLLRNFEDALSGLQPASLVDKTNSTPQLAINKPVMQQQILTALNHNESYRGTLDVAIHHYRRAILGALACLCAALLLSAILIWRLWRARKISADPAAALALVPDIDSAMIADVNELADGILTTTVRADDGDSIYAQHNRNIARAVNHTGKMMRSLVRTSRGVAAKTTDIVQDQREIAESLVQSEMQRQEHIVALVEEAEQRGHVVGELRTRQADLDISVLTGTEESQQLVNSAASAVAEMSAQVELGLGRVNRVVEMMTELAVLVDGIKSSAERSNLRALNSSIQMSVYCDGGEADESSQFVDEMQAITQKQVAVSNDAERLIRMIKADLHAADLSLSGCSSMVDENAGQSLHASNALAGMAHSFEKLQKFNTVLQDELARGQDKLHQTAIDLCDIHKGSTDNDKLLALIETTVDLQVMASKLDESLSQYKLNRDETGAR